MSREKQLIRREVLSRKEFLVGTVIGVLAIGVGVGRHVEKGYIYFAMSFSLLVELLNMRQRKTVIAG